MVMDIVAWGHTGVSANPQSQIDNVTVDKRLAWTGGGNVSDSPHSVISVSTTWHHVGQLTWETQTPSGTVNQFNQNIEWRC